MNSKITLRLGLFLCTFLFFTNFASAQQMPLEIATNPCELAFSTEVVGIFCNEETAEIVVTITGGHAPFKIKWDSHNGIWGEVEISDRSFTIDFLVRGNYQISVMDDFGCYVEGSAFVGEEVNTLGLEVTSNTTVCDVVGSIHVEVDNSMPPYSLVVRGPIDPIGFFVTSSSFDVNNITVSGDYEITVRMEDCEETAFITILNSEAPLSLDLSHIANSGEVLTSITGGHPPYRLYYDGPNSQLDPENSGLTHSDGDKLIQKLSSGEYTFTVIDAEMCMVEQTLEVTAPMARIGNLGLANTQINPLQTGLAMHQLSPNPTSQNIDVTFSANLNELVTISVRDMLGRTLLNQQEQATGNLQTTNFILSTIPAGVYYMTLTNGNEISTKKFLKK